MNPETQVPPTIPASFARSLAEFGPMPAIVTAQELITYAELDVRSRAFARALVAAGVGKGSRVALLAPNGSFWIAMFLGCMRVGALLSPISTLSTAAETAQLLRYSDAQFLVSSRRYLNHDFAATLAAAIPSLADANPGALQVAEAPFLRGVWLDDPDGYPWALPVAELLARGAADPGLDDGFLDAMTAEVAPSDDGVVIYTSGSTALPKAVIHTQGGMARHARALAAQHCIAQGERILPMLPLFWVGGLNVILEAFAHGACLLFPETPSVESVAEAIETLGADRLQGWPALRNPVRELLEARGFDLERVRGLRTERGPDGQPLPANAFANMLGMTESFGPHSSMPSDYVLPENQRGTSGQAVSGVERRIVDPETGQELPAGQVGELQLRGGALMKGFYKRERHEVFTPDGFYGTHDMARIDPDGLLYFQGRTGDVLKSRGANVSRLEVEAALRAHPDVAETVVCGLPDEALGQRVVAAVVPRPGSHPTEAALLAALRDQLSAYKVPRNIVLMERSDLIWSGTGKIRVPEMQALIAERLGMAAGERP